MHRGSSDSRKSWHKRGSSSHKQNHGSSSDSEPAVKVQVYDRARARRNHERSSKTAEESAFFELKRTINDIEHSSLSGDMKQRLISELWQSQTTLPESNKEQTPPLSHETHLDHEVLANDLSSSESQEEDPSEIQTLFVPPQDSPAAIQMIHSFLVDKIVHKTRPPHIVSSFRTGQTHYTYKISDPEFPDEDSHLSPTFHRHSVHPEEELPLIHVSIAEEPPLRTSMSFGNPDLLNHVLTAFDRHTPRETFSLILDTPNSQDKAQISSDHTDIEDKTLITKNPEPSAPLPPIDLGDDFDLFSIPDEIVSKHLLPSSMNTDHLNQSGPSTSQKQIYPPPHPQTTEIRSSSQLVSVDKDLSFLGGDMEGSPNADSQIISIKPQKREESTKSENDDSVVDAELRKSSADAMHWNAMFAPPQLKAKREKEQKDQFHRPNTFRAKQRKEQKKLDREVKALESLMNEKRDGGNAKVASDQIEPLEIPATSANPLVRHSLKKGAEALLTNLQLFYLNSHGYFTTTEENFAIYYETYGAGPTKVLIVPGWGGHMDDHRHLLISLLENEAFEICIFDHRGIGFSESPVRFLSIQLFATDALGLLDHLGWDRVCLYGESMGGMVALQMYENEPKRIESAVFVATTCGPYFPTLSTVKTILQSAPARNRTEQLLLTRPILFSNAFLSSQVDDEGMTGKDFLDQSLSYLPFSDEKMRAVMSLGQGVACFRHRISALALQAAKAISPHVMVIHGTADTMITYRHGLKLAQVLDCPLLTLEGVGHSVHLERTSEIATLLNTFFTQQAS
ncbi:putative Alpha/Beta hydrolase protein [Blattamonas nauphoetae]|uniref:Alpha/Beta hydrolase protein n=1 Tax=Blattamonas nauphoetae TaxID=2049346 RepID=A0ABQ9Y705_9EUKA|nr:putative Alpha/Beta hydrolase protein [Blattamonas nauphoetae]